MSLNNKNNQQAGGKKFEILPVDTYPARVWQVIDLGMQARPAWKGQDKSPCQQFWVTYQLPDEFLKDDDGNDIEGKPRWISERLNIFSRDQDNAKSTARLNAFDPTNEIDEDWSAVLGMGCQVSVVHGQSKGTTYANVGNVLAAGKRTVVPDLIGDPIMFDIDEPDMDIFNELPQFLQDIIVSNMNYKGSVLEAKVEGTYDEVAEGVEEDERPY